jgi:tetratricopeptide (TPR) repeat protein
MSTFDKLLAKLNSVTGEGDALLELNIMLWESGMLLNAEQYNEVVTKIKKIEKTSAQAKCYDLLNEGVLYSFHPSYGNCFDKLTEAIEAFQKINDKSGEGAIQSLLVIHYKNNGQLGKAQEYVQASIQNIGADKAYVQFLMINYYQAGEMHHLLKDYDAAITYYSTGLTYATNNPGFETRLYAGLGTVYRDSNEPEKAHDYFRKALKLSVETHNFVMESRTYADIGNYHFQKEDFEQAVSFQLKSIALRQKHNMKNPLITNYIELAEAYQKLNKPQEALQNALLAEKLAKEQNIVIKLYQIYLIISNIYEVMGNTALALDYYKKYHQTKEEVFSQESARKIKQLSLQHEMQTMEQEKELFKLRNVVLKEALDELEAQKKIVDEQHKEVMDSIHYAKRIQTALITNEKYIANSLNRLMKND